MITMNLGKCRLARSRARAPQGGHLGANHIAGSRHRAGSGAGSCPVPCYRARPGGAGQRRPGGDIYLWPDTSSSPGTPAQPDISISPDVAVSPDVCQSPDTCLFLDSFLFLENCLFLGPVALEVTLGVTDQRRAGGGHRAQLLRPDPGPECGRACAPARLRYYWGWSSHP